MPVMPCQVRHQDIRSEATATQGEDRIQILFRMWTFRIKAQSPRIMFKLLRKSKVNDDKLWRVFSLYIRLRDAKPFTGIGTCITCRTPVHYTDGDCGHGIGRQHKATKYHEQNNHLQCRSCNRFNEGRKDLYSKAVDRLYGPGTWSKLEVLSRGTCKRSQFEIDIMTVQYRALAEKLRKDKNLTN